MTQREKKTKTKANNLKEQKSEINKCNSFD